MRYLSLVAAAIFSTWAWAAIPQNERDLYREGEVLVKYRSDARSPAAMELKGRLGMSTRSRLIDARHEWLRLPAMTTVKSALDVLRREPSVEYAEPNFRRFKKSVTPNDPLFGEQWGLKNTGQPNFVAGGPAGVPGGDMNLPAAWSITKGDGSVTVGIIDDAVFTAHEDLVNNIAAGGASFTSDTSSTGDPSRVVVGNDPNPTATDQVHGTWVAGCIGAEGNNGKGVAGVAWNVKLLPLKFDFFTGAEVVAMQYATQHGARIINGSFGGPTFSQTELDAINALEANDILFVVAAGNEDSNTDLSQLEYPANYNAPNIVAVAATNRQDEIASFSSYGPTSVDVAAPGLQIVSTAVNFNNLAATNLYSTHPNDVAGTSFASPYTAGVAALLRMQFPSAKYPEIKARLIEGADPGLGTDFGTRPDARRTAGGRVNAANSLTLAARPSIVLKNLSFSAPLDPGTTPGVDLSLDNNWVDATGVTATLQASTNPSADASSEVAVTSGATTPVDIAGGASAPVHFDLAVTSGLARHAYVYFTLQISANSGAYSVKRHFISEIGTLSSGVTVTQPFQADLYDDFHTWHLKVPAGTGSVTFTSTTASTDIDLMIRAGRPAQYEIALGCTDPACAVFCTSGTTSDCQDPAVSVGGSTTGNETVTISNAAPGDYFVTVVNFGQPVDGSGNLATYNYTLTGTPAPQQLQFSASSYTASSGPGTANVAVSRQGGSRGTVSATFSTSDGSAIAGTHYTATTTTVSFADGVTTQTVHIPILADPGQTAQKTVNLALSNAGGGAVLGAPVATVLNIPPPPVSAPAPSGGGGGGGGGPVSPAVLMLFAAAAIVRRAPRSASRPSR